MLAHQGARAFQVSAQHVADEGHHRVVVAGKEPAGDELHLSALDLIIGTQALHVADQLLR